MDIDFNESGTPIKMTKGEFLERLGFDVEELVEAGLVDEEELEELVGREAASWCCSSSSSSSCNCTSSSTSSSLFGAREEREQVEEA